MVQAFGMVILSQNLSTGNGQIPGWSCILSVDIIMIINIYVLQCLYKGLPVDANRINVLFVFVWVG